MAANRLLIVEDEPNSITMQKHLQYLKTVGYLLEIVQTGEDALSALDRQFDAALLDVNLMASDAIQKEKDLLTGAGLEPFVPEEGQGFQIAALARHKWPSLGILMLTSERLSDDDVITGLDCGADDYMPKSASSEVLSAKLRAILKRSGQRELPSVQVGNLMLNVRGKALFSRDGVSVLLTQAETRVIERLAIASQKAVTREDLLAWALPHKIATDGESQETALRAIDTLVSKLRRKVQRALSISIPIETVYGKGYRLA